MSGIDKTLSICQHLESEQSNLTAREYPMVDLDDLSDAQKGGICCCFILFIVSIGLFGGSFAIVEPNHVGLDFNMNTLSIDKTKVWESGRYFLGLGHSFLTFPTTLQTIEFGSGPDAFSGDLEVFSSEGQTIGLEVSFQYRLPSDLKLVEIYSAFEKNYGQAFAREATTVLKNTATGYTVTEYYEKRSNISASMLAALKTNLIAAPKYATVEYLQLRDIGIPSQIEQKVIDTVVTEQEMKTAEEQKEVTVIRSSTKVIESEADAEITKLIAVADASSFKTTKEAEAEGAKTVLNAEGGALASLASSLKLNGTELLNYIWTRTIRSAGANSTLVIGFSGSTVLTLGN